MKTKKGLVGIGGALLFPFFAEAAATSDFRSFVLYLVSLLNIGTALLFSFVFLLFLWNIASNIGEFGKGGWSGGWEKLQHQVIWGIVSLFIVASVWGLIALLQQTLFGQGYHSSLYLSP